MPRPADVELHHTYNAPVPEGAARCCVMLPITPNYFQLRGVRLLPAGIRENDRQWTGGGDRRQTPRIHSRPATPRRGLNSTATTGCGDPGDQHIVDCCPCTKVLSRLLLCRLTLCPPAVPHLPVLISICSRDYPLSVSGYRPLALRGLVDRPTDKAMLQTRQPLQLQSITAGRSTTTLLEDKRSPDRVEDVRSTQQQDLQRTTTSIPPGGTGRDPGRD
jgi:hypothetical protein